LKLATAKYLHTHEQKLPRNDRLSYIFTALKTINDRRFYIFTALKIINDRRFYMFTAHKTMIIFELANIFPELQGDGQPE